jgi:hypothetical protein
MMARIVGDAIGTQRPSEPGLMGSRVWHRRLRRSSSAEPGTIQIQGLCLLPDYRKILDADPAPAHAKDIASETDIHNRRGIPSCSMARAESRPGSRSPARAISMISGDDFRYRIVAIDQTQGAKSFVKGGGYRPNVLRTENSIIQQPIYRHTPKPPHPAQS